METEECCLVSKILLSNQFLRGEGQQNPKDLNSYEKGTKTLASSSA